MMKYLNIGIRQIVRNLAGLKETKWDNGKTYIYGYTNSIEHLAIISEYCDERDIFCRHETIDGIIYLEVELNDRGQPGWESYND